MKFLGATYISLANFSKILSLNPTAHLGFDNTTKYLKFQDNGVDVFKYIAFEAKINYWIPITMSFYNSVSPVSAYYPSMFSMFVNNNELFIETAYTLPLTGIPISEFSLISDCAILMAELNFYKTYFHGPFSKMMRY